MEVEIWIEIEKYFFVFQGNSFMKWNKYIVIENNWVIVLLLIILIGFAGCAQRGFRIEPLSNHDTAYLSLKDIVGLMLRAGFPDDQIHLYGSDLRDVLAKSGAARVYNKNVEEATFTVDDDCVYVISKSKGVFIYNLRKGLFESY
jgi:hypothetical protein